MFERIRVELGLPLTGISVLDVGCDTGALLASAAKEYGIVPFGVDVSARAVEVARRNGLTVYHGTMEAIPVNQRFKIITLTDVVEHVPDPGMLLQQIYVRLEAGGIAYIQTPNLKSTIYQLGRVLARFAWPRLNKMVDRLFPVQHIQYFSRKGLTDIVNNQGFQITVLKRRILPLPELGVPVFLRLPLMSLQLLDVLLGRQILLCALLRKPEEPVPANGRESSCSENGTRKE